MIKKLSLIIVLAACAPAENVSETSFGSAEILELGVDTARVTVLGNGSQTAANWDALLSSAEYAKSRNYEYFQILTGGPQGVDSVLSSLDTVDFDAPNTQTTSVVLAIKLVNQPGPDTLRAADVLEILG